MNIRNRLPEFEQILQVYSVIVLMIYGWTIYWYIWKIPSWIYYLPIGNILSIYTYAASVNFLESLLIIFGLVAVAVILPFTWLKESFAAVGSAFIIPSLAYIMYVSGKFEAVSDNYYPRELLHLAPYILITALMFAFITAKWNVHSRILSEISSRTVIFVYISIPVSVLSIVYVLVKNLVGSR